MCSLTSAPMPSRYKKKEWSHLYKRKAWQLLRELILTRDRFQCQWLGCGKLLIGKHPAHNSPAVHHKVDHKGDETLFFDENNCIAICKLCHDSSAQRATNQGYINGNDKDGRPLDPNHPWNANK